jgi:hypothetical protein
LPTSSRRSPDTRCPVGRASFEIEDKRPLTQSGIYRLHRILIGDDRLPPSAIAKTGSFRATGTKRHDTAMRGIMNEIEMPDGLARQVILFMTRNDGKSPKRRRDRGPFLKLTDDQIAALEAIVTTAFAES